MCKDYFDRRREASSMWILITLQTLLQCTALCQSRGILFPAFLTLSSHIYSGGGYNLDVNFSTIATVANKSSYFGFSVGLSKTGNESWLLVGAPRSSEDGEVFRCQYEIGHTSSNCSAIHLVTEKKGASNVATLLGLTMLPEPNGKELLVCAPRFTEKTTETSLGVEHLYYDMVGICYFLHDFTDSGQSVYKMNPCADVKGEYHDGDQYGQCELGFSAAFSKDGSSLLLGAPRAKYQGSLMKLNLPIFSDVKKLPVHTNEIIPRIPRDWDANLYMSQSYDENYLGYASASAKTINNEELFLAGAPARLRNNLHGVVEVFDRNLNVQHNFVGNQMGENFGRSIATADLNNDTLDDIIIGAPHYGSAKKRIFESGRIFVYYQQYPSGNGNRREYKFSKPVIIDGTKQRAQFGYTVAAIGDINQDGYQDIAVGAPYSRNGDESQSADGSVFIFNGGPDGIVPHASQEIRGIDIDDSISAFGCSIYGDTDMDGNLYPDIIVGAYLSSHAVMIRSRPVVVIESRVTTEPSEVDLEKPACEAEGSTAATICVKITTCFSYTGENVPKSLELLYTYDADSEKTGDDKHAFILDESPRIVSLARNTAKMSEVKCVYEYLYIKPDIKDKLSDIVVKITRSLIPKNEPVQPVLDLTKPTYSVASVKIYKDCGDDGICQADLRLHSSLDKTQLYAGRSWPFVLEQRILNEGESAFLTTLVVQYPEHVNYVGILKESSTLGSALLCISGNGFVTCEIGNPMKRGAEINVNLKFQTLFLKGDISELTIRSFVNSTNPVNNTSEERISVLAIGVMSDIVFANISSPAFFYLDDQDNELRGNTTVVRHMYEVINKGPSDYSEATIELRWPVTTNDGLELLQLVGITGRRNLLACSEQEMLANAHEIDTSGDINSYYCDGRANCASITCKVNGTFEQFQVKAEFLLSYSTIDQDGHDSHIRSELDFTIDRYPYLISKGRGPTYKSMVTTEFLHRPEPAPMEVPWWIIVISVLAGLICLVILILVFWKCGFFKRKKIPKTVDETNPDVDENDTKTEVEVLG